MKLYKEWISKCLGDIMNEIVKKKKYVIKWIIIHEMMEKKLIKESQYLND